MNDTRTTRLLNNSSQAKWLLVPFFFHDRGTNIQKSLKGMLQEMLYQILVNEPRLFPLVKPHFLAAVGPQMSGPLDWSLEQLEVTLDDLVKQCQLVINVCFSLDALDEHSGDNDHLAKFLHNLATMSNSGSMRIKICIASRSWAVFDSYFGKCPGLAIH